MSLSCRIWSGFLDLRKVLNGWGQLSGVGLSECGGRLRLWGGLSGVDNVDNVWGNSDGKEYEDGGKGNNENTNK